MCECVCESSCWEVQGVDRLHPSPLPFHLVLWPHPLPAFSHSSVRFLCLLSSGCSADYAVQTEACTDREAFWITYTHSPSTRPALVRVSDSQPYLHSSRTKTLSPMHYSSCFIIHNSAKCPCARTRHHLLNTSVSRVPLHCLMTVSAVSALCMDGKREREKKRER